MKVVQGVLDREYELATVDPRIFGSFVEMLGRCVYSGIYEPATLRPMSKECAGMFWRW